MAAPFRLLGASAPSGTGRAGGRGAKKAVTSGSGPPSDSTSFVSVPAQKRPWQRPMPARVRRFTVASVGVASRQARRAAPAVTSSQRQMIVSSASTPASNGGCVKSDQSAAWNRSARARSAAAPSARSVRPRSLAIATAARRARAIATLAPPIAAPSPMAKTVGRLVRPSRSVSTAIAPT